MNKHVVFTLFFWTTWILTQLTIPNFALASDEPAASGFIPPYFQAPGPNASVKGTRVSVGFASHKEMRGLDIGVVGNITTSKFRGVALAGGFNITEGDTKIILLQLAGVTNSNYGKTVAVGAQIALGYNYHKSEAHLIGVQLASANLGRKVNIYGLQTGFYNEAGSVYGFQIGLINRTTNLHGVQIGLLNYADKNWLPVFPIINIGF